MVDMEKHPLELSKKSGAHVITSVLTSRCQWKTTIQDSRITKYLDPLRLKIRVSSPDKDLKTGKILAKQRQTLNEH